MYNYILTYIYLKKKNNIYIEKFNILNLFFFNKLFSYYNIFNLKITKYNNKNLNNFFFFKLILNIMKKGNFLNYLKNFLYYIFYFFNNFFFLKLKINLKNNNYSNSFFFNNNINFLDINFLLNKYIVFFSNHYINIYYNFIYIYNYSIFLNKFFINFSVNNINNKLKKFSVKYIKSIILYNYLQFKIMLKYIQLYILNFNFIFKQFFNLKTILFYFFNDFLLLDKLSFFYLFKIKLITKFFLIKF